MEGLVLKGIGGFYTVADEENNHYTLRAQAKIRRQKLKPYVGDRVLFTSGKGEEEGWLEAILPRKNELIRPPVANIDMIVLVVAAASPDPDLLLIDRMLISATTRGIPAMLVINKTDLNEVRADEIARQYRDAGLADIRVVCAEGGERIGALREALTGKIHAFGGQSGVGKSTLINAMYGFDLETGELSEKIERGRHTTRHAELIPVANGGMVLDTPGFSLLELDLIDPIELQNWYREFAPYAGQCYFSPCAHLTEPNCAVRDAVEENGIDPERYARYAIHYEEMKERWRERYG